MLRTWQSFLDIFAESDQNVRMEVSKENLKLPTPGRPTQLLALAVFLAAALAASTTPTYAEPKPKVAQDLQCPVPCVSAAEVDADVATQADLDALGDVDTLADLACSQDQIARFNGTEWECATDPTPRVLVLRDGNGAVIGEIADYSDDSVQIVYLGDPADAQFFEDHPIGLLRLRFDPNETPSTFWVSEPSVFFESSDCSGPSFYQNFAIHFFHFNLMTRLYIREVSGGGQLIYVPVDITETPALVT